VHHPVTTLIHNTPLESAKSILKKRRINAEVEKGRPYGVFSGPFFYVDGQTGREFSGGGKRHEVDLFFECQLPAITLYRADVTRAISTNCYGSLRGHIVIGMGLQWGVVEQAIIIPDERGCLTLICVETTRKPRLWNHIGWNKHRSQSFDVLLPTTC
jgi:hypothetical protein